MVRRPQFARRSGAAAVEFAIVMNFVLVPLMIGVWELGRVVFVQQLVASAAREGARLAAQGQTINQTGSPTQIVTEIIPSQNGSNQPNVKATVYQTLVAAGLKNLRWNIDTVVPANTVDDLTVSFQFDTNLSPVPQPAATAQQPAPVGGQPWQGVKGQRFTLYVKVPYDRVGWTVLGLVKPTAIDYTVEWRMMVDDTFSVNPNLPAW